VASYTQLLARRYQGQLDPQADEFIRFAVDGAQRMSHLIADLLAYSRAGHEQAPLASVNCEDALDRVLFNLHGAISATGAVVTHDPLPVLLARETEVVQLFQNLVGNAIKFRRPGAAPLIQVGAADLGDEWRFFVKDNGIGIEPQHFERIMMLFQRLHPERGYPGTGIGLAICTKVVERYGGRLWVESQPSEGSTFYFTIPKDRKASGNL
jgi:two-component system, chemotaxis family, sensor kinase Cph1